MPWDGEEFNEDITLGSGDNEASLLLKDRTDYLKGVITMLEKQNIRLEEEKRNKDKRLKMLLTRSSKNGSWEEHHYQTHDSI